MTCVNCHSNGVILAAAWNTCFAKLPEGTSGMFCVWGFLRHLTVLLFLSNEKNPDWPLNTNNTFIS